MDSHENHLTVPQTLKCRLQIVPIGGAVGPGVDHDDAIQLAGGLAFVDALLDRVGLPAHRSIDGHIEGLLQGTARAEHHGIADRGDRLGGQIRPGRDLLRRSGLFVRRLGLGFSGQVLADGRDAVEIVASVWRRNCRERGSRHKHERGCPRNDSGSTCTGDPRPLLPPAIPGLAQCAVPDRHLEIAIGQFRHPERQPHPQDPGGHAFEGKIDAGTSHDKDRPVVEVQPVGTLTDVPHRLDRQELAKPDGRM